MVLFSSCFWIIRSASSRSTIACSASSNCARNSPALLVHYHYHHHSPTIQAQKEVEDVDLPSTEWSMESLHWLVHVDLHLQ